MTSHNRANLTSRCLEKLHTITQATDIDLHVILVDAGSTDNTPEHARAAFPAITVISVTGNVYWAEGMAIAEKHALEDENLSDDDVLVWLNDDVFLDDDAFERAIDWFTEVNAQQNCIVVGAMRSSTGTVTFGGLKRKRWNPLGIRLIEPTTEPVPVDTFHGNFLLVPVIVAKAISGIDGHFGHHMADIDYGVRNSALGNENILLPGTYGVCDFGGPEFSTRLDAWRFYRSLKGSGHWPTRLHFMKKHSRIARWPALIAMDILHGIRLLRRLPARTVLDESQKVSESVGSQVTRVPLRRR